MDFKDSNIRAYRRNQLMAFGATVATTVNLLQCSCSHSNRLVPELKIMHTLVYVLGRFSTKCTLSQPHSLQHKVSGHALETVCPDVLGEFYTVPHMPVPQVLSVTWISRMSAFQGEVYISKLEKFKSICKIKVPTRLSWVPQGWGSLHMHTLTLITCTMHCILTVNGRGRTFLQQVTIVTR